MALLLTAGAIAPSMASLSLANSATSSRLSFSYTQSLAGDGSFSPPSCSSISLAADATSPLQAVPSVYCGRGDKKTAKGKRFKHSFGNARPRNKKKGRGPPRVPAPPAPPRKDKFDDGEVVKIEINESLFS